MALAREDRPQDRASFASPPSLTEGSLSKVRRKAEQPMLHWLNMFRRLVQSGLGAFGYRLAQLNSTDRVNYGSSPAEITARLDSFFELIKRHGFDPKHIVDAGANHGNWTREALKYFPQAQFTLVEPQVELKIYVQDLIDAGYKVNWVHAGVSDRSGVMTFNVRAQDQASTFLQALPVVNGTARRVEVSVKTLNEIVASSGFPVPDMVKIDAEGFDLKALSGASELFGQTDIFLTEVSIGERNFENTVPAIVAKMTDVGYQLIDITDLNRSPTFGVLWLCEFVFLRSDSHLLDAASFY